MRCLYCGAEQALFKKLAGDQGQFCSEAHRQAYRDEYDRAALGRLLPAEEDRRASKPVHDPTGLARLRVAVDHEPGAAGFLRYAPEVQLGPQHQSYDQRPVETRSDGYALPASALMAEAFLAELTEPHPQMASIDGSEPVVVESPMSVEVRRESLYDRLHQKGLVGRGSAAVPLLRAPGEALAEVHTFTPERASSEMAPPVPVPVARADAPLPSIAMWTATATPDSAGFDSAPFAREIAFDASTRLRLSTTGLELLEEYPTGQMVFTRAEWEAAPAVESTLAVLAESAPATPALLAPHPPPARTTSTPARVDRPAAVAFFDPRPENGEALFGCDPLAPTALKVHLPRTMLSPLRQRIAWGPVPNPDAAVDSNVSRSAVGSLPAVKVRPIRQEPAQERRSTESGPMAHGHPSTPGNFSTPGRPATMTGDNVAEASDAAAIRDREIKDGARVRSRARRAPKTPEAPAVRPAAAATIAEVPAQQATQTPEQNPRNGNGALLAADQDVMDAPRPGTEEPALEFETPRLQVDAGEMSPISRLLGRVPGWMKAVAATALVASGGLWVAKDFGSASSSHASMAPAAPAPAPIAMGAGGWSTEWAGDDFGLGVARRLSLYRPSRSMTDYRMEFSGRIEAQAMGWVFRVTDLKNYYAMKLQVFSAGVGPQVRLVRFAVVDGDEQSRAEIDLPFRARLGELLRVRLDVKGPKFTAIVQGKVIDLWTDHQLKSGGLGFYSDRNERARIETVQISF